ncbi:NADPH oxidoreductase [compost metagenome]
MALLPFVLCRRLSPWLRPLRALVRHDWLREAEVDAWLAAVQPGWRLNRVFARVEGRRWVADDMLALTLRANGNWCGARPGQHVPLYLERDGVRLARSYSLTAVHADGRLEIAVRRQPGGRVSPRLVEYLAVGEVLELGQACGELHWRDEAPGVLLLAAGSGLTPLLGLLREALRRGFQAPVTLLHYVREQGQRAFVEELEALQRQYANLQVSWALTRPGAAGGLAGRFRPAHLGAVAGVEQRALFVCGPAGFVEQVRDWAQQAAVRGVVQSESFTPPRWPATTALASVRLRFAHSQSEYLGDNRRSLLEQAEAAGLRPAHGCRQGICAGCTCTLLDGAVRDLRSGALVSEASQPIRLCVSAAQGDVTLEL